METLLRDRSEFILVDNEFVCIGILWNVETLTLNHQDISVVEFYFHFNK